MIMALVLVTTTRYADVGGRDAVRWALAQRTAEAARAAGLPLVVVDGTPAPHADAVAATLSAAGAVVLPQVDVDGSKGSALRQALDAAARLVASGSVAATPLTLVAFQEPEKWDLVARWPAVAAAAAAALAGRTDGVVVLPQRTAAAWATYPVEQQHSEQYGNAHVANLVRACTALRPRAAAAAAGLDWFFGPFAVSLDLLPLFAAYDGAWWDAQVVPLVRAWRVAPAHAPVSVPVDFHCDPRQRAEEEGSVAYGKKRLHQLQYLLPLLERELL
jgi:hypothetical protein